MANEKASNQRDAYVRQPRPRANQGAIDDLAAPASSAMPSNPEPSFTHDSSYTLSSRNPIQSRSYRRARSEQAKVSKELKYGQYLSVPKGSREIFASRERQNTQRRAIIGIVLIAIIIILLLVFWPK